MQSFSCATYNVSSVSDMRLRLQSYADSLTDPELSSIFCKCKEGASSNEEIKKAEEAAHKLYMQLAGSTFQKNITSHSALKPDFICLQEFHKNNPEQIELVNSLSQLGYRIIGESEVCVAIQEERFEFIQSHRLSGGALCVDVQDKLSLLKIRVVSDHLVGFNAKSQKEATANLKKVAEFNAHQLGQFRDTKEWGPKQGDEDLAKNIAEVLPLPKGFLSALVDKVLSRQPDLIIYGLDANSTADYIPKPFRLHSKRLAIFSEHGFECDRHDSASTIIDLKDGVQRKYDYIFAKAKNTELKITSNAVNAPLDSPELCMSDHLPVVATITLG